MYKTQIIALGIAAVLFVACGGGGGGTTPNGNGGGNGDNGGSQLYVGQINGTNSLAERGSANYSVLASGVAGISYFWSCVPDNPAAFTPSNAATTSFRAWSVDENTTVIIAVVVSAPGYDAVTRTKTITITNSDL